MYKDNRLGRQRWLKVDMYRRLSYVCISVCMYVGMYVHIILCITTSYESYSPSLSESSILGFEAIGYVGKTYTYIHMFVIHTYVVLCVGGSKTKTVLYTGMP